MNEQASVLLQSSQMQFRKSKIYFWCRTENQQVTESFILLHRGWTFCCCHCLSWHLSGLYPNETLSEQRREVGSISGGWWTLKVWLLIRYDLRNWNLIKTWVWCLALFLHNKACPWLSQFWLVIFSFCPNNMIRNNKSNLNWVMHLKCIQSWAESISSSVPVTLVNNFL